MALIEREKKPEMVGVRVKLESAAFKRLQEYAEYMQSIVDHIVAEAADYIISRDKEFGKTRETAAPGRKGARRLAETA